MADNHANKDFIADHISQWSSYSKSKLKLPTIELRNLDDDDETAPEDNFQFLIQATISNLRARQIFECYPSRSLQIILN